MFDLLKDIDTYKGVTPYASEHYGVYQPLLGWESRLTKKWVERGGALVDPRVRSILDGRITPGPTEVQNNDAREFLAVPLEPGSGRSPYRVVLAKELGSELLKLVRSAIATFVEGHDGRLPAGPEWNQVIEINSMIDPQQGLLRMANDTLRTALHRQLVVQAHGQPITDAMVAAAKAQHLEQMRYESQLAMFLLAHAEGQGGLLPDSLAKLFLVHEAAPLDDIFRSSDPLANIDPNDTSGALSPVGFVHLFRQYFFDLGTFLGEPVEHIWLSPGTTVELIEVSTRKTLIERTEESSLETTTRSEQSSAVKDELSDAVKAENGSSTKLGVSTTNTVSFGVYQGTASASFGLESTRKDARETTHKENREQAEKLSSDIKRSFKSVFKTVTETSDTRSRRYVLQNPSKTLVNYELRRKMRRVGVQMQDLGTRLCWQVFIDDAGSSLGLSELVHFAESPDLSNLKQTDVGPPPAPIPKTLSARIPFLPIRTNDNNAVDYAYTNFEDPVNHPGSPWVNKHLGNRSNTDDEDAQDYQLIMGPFHFKFDPPQFGYKLAEVRIVGPQSNKQASVRSVDNRTDDGSFDLVLDFVNFGGTNELLLDVELVYTPLKEAMDDYVTRKAAADKLFDAEKARLVKKSYLESVRARIKDASNVKERPSWDLREEERTVVYRKLISRLMLDSWQLPDTEGNRRLSHVRSEVIRAIFDVDSMLYFVAPEWWMPRRHQSKLGLNVDVADTTVHLTDQDIVSWDDLEKRADNYRITEDSTVAKLGSSLGWLQQLDGDNLRNAFLNAPWVKAVIPIRPGREQAALNWLRAIEGHDTDGWDTPYTPVTPEDFELVSEIEAAGDPVTIGTVLEKIAMRMQQENGEITNLLDADRVFEHGFDHLAGGFDAGLPANQVFSQWISVLPTDQIVAVDYEPSNLLVP